MVEDMNMCPMFHVVASSWNLSHNEITDMMFIRKMKMLLPYIKNLKAFIWLDASVAMSKTWHIVSCHGRLVPNLFHVAASSWKLNLIEITDMNFVRKIKFNNYYTTKESYKFLPISMKEPTSQTTRVSKINNLWQIPKKLKLFVPITRSNIFLRHGTATTIRMRTRMRMKMRMKREDRTR